jgi:hypothetical protein
MELKGNVKTGELNIKTPEQEAAEAKPEKDLITRVSEVKEEAKPEVKEEAKFNINDLDASIEAVQDPKSKEQLLALKKSLISGENKKYQEIADLRKDLEAKIENLKTQPKEWTSERVQELMKDQSFVTAAQSIVGEETSESALSEKEQARIKQLEQQLRTVQQQGMQAFKAQQDEVLKAKYANYDGQAVDTITADLLEGKVQAGREDLWKVYDYEAAVKRAYKLGLEDKKLNITEKVDSASIEAGVTTESAQDVPKKNEGESDHAYFVRLGLRNLIKVKDKKK